MFDGDQMAVYVPHTIAYKDAVDKMWIDNNLRLPSNGAFTFQLKQDMVLGLNNLTKFDDSDSIEYLGQQTTNKRVDLFNHLFPEVYRSDANLFRMFNIEFTKKTINDLVDTLESQIPTMEFIKIIDKLCRVGFNNSHVTLALDDFYVEDAVHKEPKDLPDNNATRMIRSGARGSWSQYYQMAAEKGYIADITGKVQPEKVENNLLNGLSPREFFITCYGARKGLIDTADNTAKSGYLTRKLIYLLSPTIIDRDVDDCYESLGNTRYFEFFVRDESIAKMLIGRYTDTTHITKDNYKDIVGKIVNLKSPITCKANGICKKCYGDLFNIHKSGMIGIIAAQSLGERTTQLTLRTKHTSGATDTSNILGELSEYLKIDNNTIISIKPGKFQVLDESILFFFDEQEITFDNYNTCEVMLDDDRREVDDMYTFQENEELVGIDATSNDIVSAVTLLSSILNNPPNDCNLSEYLYTILDLYGSYATIAIVHFELILATLCRDKDNVSKSFRHSDSDKYKMLGLSKVIALIPEQALAFERFFFYLKKFMMNDELTNNEPAFSLLRGMLFFDFDKFQNKK